MNCGENIQAVYLAIFLLQELPPDSEDEVWNDIPEDLCEQDVFSTPPLPEPLAKQRKLHIVNSIIQWLMYFLLIWQNVCHLSDNGLSWLLQFLVQFLKAINAHAPTELLAELIVTIPTSLYMIRQFLAVNRDSFAKYVVCPTCTKCYEYNECVRGKRPSHC